MTLAMPAPNPPVEAWREDARSAYLVLEGTVLEHMNRSEIRTLLGFRMAVRDEVNC
jgi:hypothetical protein